jgi:hypothetical protein
MMASMHKILDGLYLGNIDAANNWALLKQNGITHILTVALGLQPVKGLVGEVYIRLKFLMKDLKWKRIEILDGPGENIKKHFETAIE